MSDDRNPDRSDCSETCLGFWSRLAESDDPKTANRVCHGLHIVYMKGERKDTRHFSDYKGLQIAVVVEEEGNENEATNQSRKTQKISIPKREDEGSGIFNRIFSLWQGKAERFRDGVVYYQHSPNRWTEIKDGLARFCKREIQAMDTLIQNTKPTKRLQMGFDFSQRQLKKILSSTLSRWKERKD